MAFPSSPSNGQTWTEAGTTYSYNSTYGVWDIATVASGMDADTVDGLHASQIVPTKASIDALGINAGTLDGIDSSQFMRNDITNDFFNGTTARLNIENISNSFCRFAFYKLAFYDWNNAQDIFTLDSYPIAHRPLVAEGGIYGSTSGAPDKLIWAVSASNPTWGIFYNEGTPDYIEFKAGGNKTAHIALDSGEIWSAGDIITASDARLKSDITDLTHAIETVQQLNGKAYIKDGKPSLGFIAQEVEEVLPQVVHTDNTEEGYKSVNYQAIVPLLVEAIKEQQKQIDELKEQINGI